MGITWQRRGRLEELQDGSISDSYHTVAYALSESGQAGYDHVDYDVILNRIDDNLDKITERLKDDY